MRKLLCLLVILLPLPALADEVAIATTSYTKSISDALTQTQILGSQTRRARVTCSVSCFVATELSPVQSFTTPIYLPSEEPTIIRVSPSGRIVVTAGASGTLRVEELSQ